MSALIRTSFSIERDLFDKLEALTREGGYENRSELLRDLIRARLVTSEWEKDDAVVVGTITMIYDHHKRELSESLTRLQHHHHRAVLATTHIHLSEDICAEMIMVKATAKTALELTRELRRRRGVLFAELTMASTGEMLR